MFKYAAFLAIIIFALTGCAPPPADTSADLAEIKSDVVAWVAAFNAGDADGIAALYSEDGVVMAPGADAAVGQAAIRDMIAADIVDAKAQGLTFMASASSDGAIDGDLGWASGTFAVSDSSGAVVGTGKYVSAHERINGEWQMVRDIWNSDAPANSGQQLAEAYIAIWNSQELDQIDELISADFRRRAPDQNADGPAEIKVFMANVHDTYANFRIELEATAAADDVVFLHWKSISNGLKTDEQTDAIEVDGISILRHADGKITEEIVHYDTATLNAKLGTGEIPHVK
jgi:ketosteroid isomerase-like protein/predicted SnoaL-like aldol condensation-catalyzing enzyme